MRFHGSLEAKSRFRKDPTAVCSLAGCEAAEYRIGLCQHHYNQHRYDLTNPGRAVVEKAIGRKLKRQERVFFINGDKTDSRLENLEFWARDHNGTGLKLTRIGYIKDKVVAQKTTCKLCSNLDILDGLCGRHLERRRRVTAKIVV